MHQEPTLRPLNSMAEYPALVAIWRSAVEATHGFLAPQHRDEIERLLPSEYFPQVVLTVADVAGRPVGFSGTSGDALEMLFVNDRFRGRGVGSALLTEAVARRPGLRVDVNEQNSDAHSFYLARGFREVARSAVDGQGWPYPLIHLRHGSTVSN